MTDWVGEMDPEERDAWDDFVEDFRRNALEKIAGSAAFISIAPSDGKGDVKFWVELGCAITMDKPILTMISPGMKLSAKLRAVSDTVVELDIDTEEGRDKAGKEVAEFLADKAKR